MHTCFRSLILVAALLPACDVTAQAGTPVSSTEAFTLLKGLAGEWSGTVTERDTGPAVTVIYRLTAGGSVVEERLFPGTAHEMVTMYHLEGGRLVLTHYCAMGNQPRMALSARSTPAKLDFAFESAGNLESPGAMHMHSGWIRFVDADTIEAAWDVFHEDAKAGENLFFLKRRMHP